MSAFLNLIALISLITSIVFFVKGFKNKPKFKKATLFFVQHGLYGSYQL